MLASRRISSLAASLLLCTVSAPLSAATVGFELRLGGGTNAPIFHLLNTSPSASISRASITVGDGGFNFHTYVVKNLNNVNFTSCTLDEEDGNARVDELCADFSDFTPGKAFRVKADLDVDDQDTKEDFTRVLFQLGGTDESDNSLMTVNFSDGTILSGNLPDYATKPDGAYVFALSQNVPDSSTPAIPLPPGLWAGLGLLGGLGALGLVRKSLRRLS